MIPEQIDTYSTSSCDSEETSTITLNKEQLLKKRKKKRLKRDMRHKKKLKSLKTNEKRRKLTMAIKAQVYEDLAVNAAP